ncbi:hypothetical protein TNCV_3751311 [Trichonephila clavipes]|uniref:Uncharacterized protein n=1 Tax=Trichonephila clavipes TaxID=2585209 RepID=A0A8X6R1V1_TRICX|nr:hypothetical protein TNCV_3751311 [Trichonephila clavipes]
MGKTAVNYNAVDKGLNLSKLTSLPLATGRSQERGANVRNFDQGSKLRGPSPVTLALFYSASLNTRRRSRIPVILYFDAKTIRYDRNLISATGGYKRLAQPKRFPRTYIYASPKSYGLFCALLFIKLFRRLCCLAPKEGCTPQFEKRCPTSRSEQDQATGMPDGEVINNGRNKKGKERVLDHSP